MASSSGLNNIAMISVPLILDLELVQLKSQNLLHCWLGLCMTWSETEAHRGQLLTP